MAAAQHKFVLVKFETDECDVASTSWLIENETKCAWPNYQSPNAIVRAIGQHKKQEAGWKIYKIKILGGGKRFGKLKLF